MSGILAGKVWLSGLAPHLKPLAAALADSANDDGSDIYPGVPYVAWKLGASERTVQFGMKALRDMKILVTVADELGGRGRRTQYRMDAAMLRARAAWAVERKRKGEKSSPFVETEKGEAEIAKGCSLAHLKGEGNDTKGCSLEQERVIFDALSEPVSLNDPSVPVSETSVEHTRAADASLFALTTPPDSDHAAEQHQRRQFERLVHIYPRQAAMAAAWKEFQRINPTDPVVDEMLAQIERHKRTVWGGVEPRFIPHLRTWLHQRRWEDGEDISPVSDAELRKARQRLGQAYCGHCPHSPRCETVIGCLKEIALHERTHATQQERAS